MVDEDKGANGCDGHASDTGYNRWAEPNRIVVLYPQNNSQRSLLKSEGCWDFFGYDSDAYGLADAPQMRIIAAMIARAAGQTGWPQSR